MQEFSHNRKKLIDMLEDDSIVIIPSAITQYRNKDTEYPFRQNSNFYYLTGFAEPSALCVLLRGKTAQESKYILFNLPKDPATEVWTGIRVGQQQAVAIYGADEAYDIAEAAVIIPKLLKNKRAIYYPIGENKKFDNKVISWLKLVKTKIVRQARELGEKITCLPNALRDVNAILHELRLFKTTAEISILRKAAEISMAGHLQLMQACKPEMYEYELAAIFTKQCMQAGCSALAYQIIVASGANACILHYTANNRPVDAGELIVIDAGAEYKCYAADITRTIPVTGKFTPAQRLLYDLVLKSQLAGLNAIKPGNPFASVQAVVTKTLVLGLLEYGILTGDVDTLLKTHAYKPFYMHSASHWIGLDVHDVGDYFQAGESRSFAEGMVLTIEPGLYIAPDAVDVAEQWRGIGIRIEDMVLVTAHGHDVLTKDLPKAADDIEKIMAA